MSAVKKISIFDNVKADEVDGVLPHTVDKYDGVTVDTHDLPNNVEEFQSILDSSLSFWKINRRRGVWLKIPIDRAILVAPAVAAGFVFHHAEKNYVMMNNWLSEEENRMPANATHQIGVGCIVINHGKLLMVQEKNGPLRGTGIWKMPTGLSDAGEDLFDAAVREVLEETGIETEFVSILSVRQSHTALFGKSDLFFVCLLRPKTTTIHMQAAEVSACDWIDADEYLNQKFFMKSPIFVVVHDQIRKTLLATANDPRWAIPQDTPEQAAHTLAQTIEHAHTHGVAVGQVPSAHRMQDLPVPSMVVSKLPNGLRPGTSVLYHFPISP